MIARASASAFAPRMRYSLTNHPMHFVLKRKCRLIKIGKFSCDALNPAPLLRTAGDDVDVPVHRSPPPTCGTSINGHNGLASTDPGSSEGQTRGSCEIDPVDLHAGPLPCWPL